VKTHTLKADIKIAATMEEPNKILPVKGNLPFKKDMNFELVPYNLIVVEVTFL
jgi:hypothetical protein